MATATQTTRGFGVCCPHCHDGDAVLTLNLNDLGEITCPVCDAVFTAAEAVELVREQLAAWQRLAAWIELAPVRTDD